MRTLAETREYVRTVFELDDILDSEIDEAIRHAYNSVVSEEDWPQLRQRRLLNATQLDDKRWAYPITGELIRRVKSVWAVNADTHETHTLEYVTFDNAIEAGEYRDGPRTTTTQQRWTRLATPYHDETVNAPNGLILVFPNRNPPEPHIATEIVQQPPTWPNTLSSSDSQPPLGQTTLTPGLETVLEHYLIAEMATKYGDSSIASRYLNFGDRQLEKERRNIFPSVNTKVALGQNNYPKQRVRRTGRR